MSQKTSWLRSLPHAEVANTLAVTRDGQIFVDRLGKATRPEIAGVTSA
jgi:hypothetical protein